MLNKVRKGHVPQLARARRTLQPGLVDGREAVSGPVSARLVHFGLSARESEVMAHLAQGLLYKEIADQMKVSYAVVHKLQHKVFVKLQVSNRTQAVVKWYRNALQ
jgi:DNA-binding CsgD family transcriptional regulator